MAFLIPPWLSSIRLDPFARRDDDLMRDAVVVVELSAGVSDRGCHRLRPDVLPDQQRGRGIRLELLPRGHQVVLVEQSTRRRAEVLESLPYLRIEVGELEGRDIAALILAHECDIDDPDRP